MSQMGRTGWSCLLPLHVQSQLIQQITARAMQSDKTFGVVARVA